MNVTPKSVYLHPSIFMQVKFAHNMTIIEIFFAANLAHSSCIAEERFYPCSGGEGTADCEGSREDNIINIALTPIGPGPWDPAGRLKLTAKQRQKLIAKASEEMRYVTFGGRYYYYYCYYYSHIFPGFRAQHCNYATLLAGRCGRYGNNACMQVKSTP